MIHSLINETDAPPSRNDPCTVKPVPSPVLEVRNLSVRFGRTPVFEKIDLAVPPRSAVAVLGPSGKGKSTLLRCINRLLDDVPGAKVSGEIHFHGTNILGPAVDADALRARIGMLFQQPQVFPTTIEKNVLFGVSRLRKVSRRERPALVEHCLREAALWEQVRDRLKEPAGILSIGQQQRLCLARTLANNPEVILLDEPTSALDTETTAAIEDTFLRLKRARSLILVTHDPRQAARLGDHQLRL